MHAQGVLELTHAKRLYTDKLSKYCRESKVLEQDIRHKYQNARLSTETIDISLYPYDDPFEHFMTHQSHFLSEEVLRNMQAVSLPYWQLHRTTNTDIRYELMNKICVKAQWINYVKHFSDFTFKMYPQPLSQHIFDLLRPGNTLFAWSSQENHDDFWLTNDGVIMKKTFPRYPCPAPVFRLLHSLCYLHSWNVLKNFGYQSPAQYSCALYSFHLLSSVHYFR